MARRTPPTKLIHSEVHRAYFSNHPDRMPSTTELSACFTSYDKLLRVYHEVVAAVLPDLPDFSIEPELIYFEAEGSWAIKWLIKAFGGKDQTPQELLESFVKSPKTKGIIGDKTLAIGVVLFAIIVSIALWYAKNKSGRTSAEVSHLEAIQDQALTLAVEHLDVSRDVLLDELHRIADSRPSLGRHITKVVQPVRRDTDAFIQFDEHALLKLKPEAIAEIPPLLVAAPKEKTDTRRSVYASVRATDLDDKKKWAAIINAIAPDRVSMELAISSLDDMAGVTWLVGDFDVRLVQDDDDNWIPVKYTLRFIESSNKQPNLFGQREPLRDNSPDAPSDVENESDD